MLAIGVGLMAAPSLLMLDEPTLGLAPKVKEELITAIRNVAAIGVGMLLVDQDLELIADLSDRSYLMDRGQLTAVDLTGQSSSTVDLRSIYFGAKG